MSQEISAGMPAEGLGDQVVVSGGGLVGGGPGVINTSSATALIGD